MEKRITIVYPSVSHRSAGAPLDTFHEEFVKAVRNGGTLCEDLSDIFKVRIYEAENETRGIVEFV